MKNSHFLAYKIDKNLIENYFLFYLDNFRNFWSYTESFYDFDNSVFTNMYFILAFSS